MSCSIIIPSRYPDIFESCRESLDRFAPNDAKVLVRDGQGIEPPAGWLTIQGPEGKFNYSRNINLGLNRVAGDIVLMNDDVTFTHGYTTEILRGILDQHPDVGIISPKILGGVGEHWQGHATAPLHYTDTRLAFVCVMIRSEIVDKIGPLDERFLGYGWDDVDYCRRVVLAGYRLAVTASAVVKHGHGGKSQSSSFSREGKNYSELERDSIVPYMRKWGDAKTGDFLKQKPVTTIPRDSMTIDWWDTHPRK